MLKKFIVTCIVIITASNTLAQNSSMSYANFSVSKNKIGGEISAVSNTFGISLPLNDTLFMTASFEDSESDNDNIKLDGIQFGLGHITTFNDVTDFVSYVGFGTNTADFDAEDISADIDTRIINLGVRAEVAENTEIQFFVSNTDIDIDAQGNIDFYYESGENTSIDFNVAHYYSDNIALITGIGFDRQGEDINFGLRFDL